MFVFRSLNNSGASVINPQDLNIVPSATVMVFCARDVVKWLYSTTVVAIRFVAAIVSIQQYVDCP